jgi:hypothetical protein
MTEPRDKSRLLKVAVAVVFFAAAGTIFYLNRAKSEDVVDQSKWKAELECHACKHRFNTTVEIDVSGDALECPKCRKRAAWPLKVCFACDHKFAPKLVGDPPRPEAMPSCPKCGTNKNVGAAIPDPEYYKAMKELAGQGAQP